MCRVRFGLTDVHFEELQPTFPRRAYYRASVAAVPGSGNRRLGPLIPIFVDEKPDAAKKEMVVSEPSPQERGAASRLDWHIDNKRKRRKRKNSANATSSKGLALSSQSSTSSSHSGDRAHNSRLAKPTKKNNPASAFANCASKSHPAAASPQMHDQKKPSAAALSESSREAPTAKRVRFAMDLKTAGPRSFPLYAEDDSSEIHSSQESMIDPGPFPPYPVGGFGCPRPPGLTVSPCAGSSTGLVAGPKSGPTVGPNVESVAELLTKSPTQPTKAQSTQTPQEWSPVLSHKSSTASLSETPDVYSGSYRALDAPRPYQKKKVPDSSLSAKSNLDQSDSKSDSFNTLKSSQIIISGKLHQQQNIQYKDTGTGASVLSLKSDAEEETEVKAKEESVSESESESDDGEETDSDEGAQLVAQAVLLTRTNGELLVRPNKESRFAKLHPAKKLPKSILKAGSKLFGAKGKAQEKAKPMVARSPSVSAIDEEDESD
ncbi:hypothetical protein N7G274_006739 [Stereocaulon virgatum]|uniref:Uncharacterized protein n=1 Tax=Stereocaulon virgatum TaxID=373712 RepID=A0ABR4A4K1_9LECA